MRVWLGSAACNDFVRWHSLSFDLRSDGKVDDNNSSVFRKVFETLKANF